MKRSVVCEWSWKNLIQHLSLNMFLDFNVKYFYLNPGRPLISSVWVGVRWICSHRFPFLWFYIGSFCAECLSWVGGGGHWPDLELEEKVHGCMLKCKNPTSELVPTILSPQMLILDKWMVAWHTGGFFSISKTTLTSSHWVVRLCGELGSLLLCQSIPGFSISFLEATFQPQYSSEHGILLNPHHWNQIPPS